MQIKVLKKVTDVKLTMMKVDGFIRANKMTMPFKWIINAKAGHARASSLFITDSGLLPEIEEDPLFCKTIHFEIMKIDNIRQIHNRGDITNT